MPSSKEVPDVKGDKRSKLIATCPHFYSSQFCFRVLLLTNRMHKGHYSFEEYFTFEEYYTFEVFHAKPHNFWYFCVCLCCTTATGATKARATKVAKAAFSCCRACSALACLNRSNSTLKQLGRHSTKKCPWLCH
jgi:hypothetical protein